MTTRFSGCGIAGLAQQRRDGDYTTDTVAAAASAVVRMTDALAHRGPHGAGHWQGPGIMLGHRRLAVTDLGPTGAQPMTRDQLTIVYNGETYNAPALRAELADHYRFTTGTDTEVVLRAWQHWGTAAVHRLAGMYAFAIWDNRRRCLTLVRDRIGIKPLYYHCGSDMVVFASEIEALLASGLVPRRPDAEVLAHQLLCSTTLQADPSRTPVAGVQALPPATYLTWHPDGRHQQTTYWRLPQTAQPARTSIRRSARELGELLTGSVSSMLMGDVPVAAFLSGGLDSSAVCALAADHQPLTCLTTAYTSGSATQEADSGDLPYSRLVANHLKDRVRHHVTVQENTLALADLDAVCDLAAVGDDSRHVAILRNYQALRELGTWVVLNGQGADEIMGGYVARPGFVRHILDVRRPDAATIQSLPASRQVPGLSPHVLAMRAAAHETVLSFHRTLPGASLERAHRLLFHTQLARVVQFEDFLSMRASVEARFPFLDHHIVEWAFARPFDTHVHGPSRQGKVILRHALRHRLPTRVLGRVKAVFPHANRDQVRRALAAIAVAHAREIRQDPLITHLFEIPSEPNIAPLGQLWALLYLWRWHHRLTARSAPNRTPGAWQPAHEFVSCAVATPEP